MPNIFKISEAASLALHAMLFVVTNPERAVSTHEIATDMRVSETHLAKVMQRLVHAGLVHSTRGPGGGFTLARAADTITLLDIYEVIEGPLAATTCLLGKPVCGGSPSQCMLGGFLQDLGDQARRHLATTHLSDISNGGHAAA